MARKKSLDAYESVLGIISQADEPLILLFQRQDTAKENPGYWELPRWETLDPSAGGLADLKAQIKRDLGIEVSLDQIIAYSNRCDESSKAMIDVTIIIGSAKVIGPHPGKAIPLPAKYQLARWFSRADVNSEAPSPMDENMRTWCSQCFPALY
jgi:hypothetical protein